MQKETNMAEGSGASIEAASSARRLASPAAWAGYVACAAALAYALPRLWWGLGIPLAFPGDFSDTPGQP